MTKPITSEQATAIATLQQRIRTCRLCQQDGMLLLPLAHPSGVSRWLNDPEHHKLHQKALKILSEWRLTYAL